ncbi:single-stranded DNA-binding protein ssb [Streptococcus pseudoporcinus]|uniref:Single-stranded DNA-binding protein n=1 Tax=Streptococcus pseudoporcinus TaxID=361101 RepID=A0A4U9Y1T5_9STRE|nr:single-stranded DNA-binding protein [Streptococcus pseudoporcinus]QBX18698.1 single-stranded DNA-binding protein [Streptococcus phage Javan443]QBX18783.1 single-stranded DNA-binding protein [Streptococcus phage Javan445]VTS19606.1 single-stranded DNA-binding protein ssb [Streptococcus pseudoporcinus]VUC69743.1 single-stranded DNA-binding protein ssb [Streptococcus pseudoporcinus]VUD00013.1 single-stranded DNA-binding protein ssb [Streptococcus pseudoporcinus]
MNNVSLVGRLTRDVELKYTNSQTAVATGTLAVNRTFKSQNGEREADFINIVAWRKTAEILSNYTSKGSQVGVVGRIQTRNYEGNDGKRVYVTEVVAESVALLDNRSINEQQPVQKQEAPFSNSSSMEIDESDLPF